MKKYWGSIVLEDIKEAIDKAPGALKNYNGKRELKLDAVMFDDGAIGLSVYNIETKERIRVGSIRPSTFK